MLMQYIICGQKEALLENLMRITVIKEALLIPYSLQIISCLPM